MKSESNRESCQPYKEEKRIDVYALGFEEIVDLDAKNIVLASSENARQKIPSLFHLAE